MATAIYYDDEAITVTITTSTGHKFDTAKTHPAAGAASQAVLQLRGGSIIWRDTGSAPVAASNLGFVANDGASWVLNGIANLDNFQAHKVSGDPILYVMYGR